VRLTQTFDWNKETQNITETALFYDVMPPKRQYLSTKVRHHIAENCNLHTAIKNETSQKSIIFILKVFTGLKSIFYKFPKMPLV